MGDSKRTGWGCYIKKGSMMQKRVYFLKWRTNEVMALPVKPLNFYHVAESAGWERCTKKEYKAGLLKRKLITGSYNLQK